MRALRTTIVIKRRPNGYYCYRMKMGKSDKSSTCYGSYGTKEEARKAASQHARNIRLDMQRLRRRWDREIAAEKAKRNKKRR